MNFVVHRIPSLFFSRQATPRPKNSARDVQEPRGQHNDTRYCVDNDNQKTHPDNEAKWQDLRLLKRKLRVSIDEEDFFSAASLRDSIQILLESLTPAEQYAMKLLKLLHESHCVEERLSLLSSIAEVGNVNIIPDIAQLLHNPTLCKRAEMCIMALMHKNSDPEVNRLMDIGAAAMTSKHYQEALNHFESVTVLDPTFAEGHNKKATTLYLMNNYEESIKVCHLVIDLQPYHFGALAGLGLCFYRLGDYENAIQAFEQALFVNPGLSRIRFMADTLRNGNLPSA